MRPEDCTKHYATGVIVAALMEALKAKLDAGDVRHQVNVMYDQVMVGHNNTVMDVLGIPSGNVSPPKESQPMNAGDRPTAPLVVGQPGNSGSERHQASPENAVGGGHVDAVELTRPRRRPINHAQRQYLRVKKYLSSRRTGLK
jgi:hypothetical protein